jgi:hypothetical protein
MPPGNRVCQTRVMVLYNLNSLPFLFFHSTASLTPHASASLKPHASLTPPPPSASPHLTSRLPQPHLTPPSRLRLRQPHLTSRRASLSLTSRLTPGDFQPPTLFSHALLYHSPSRSNRFSL